MLAYRHVPPCGRGSTNPAGSGAHGAAERLYSFRPLPPPPLLWHLPCSRSDSDRIRLRRVSGPARRGLAPGQRPKGGVVRWLSFEVCAAVLTPEGPD